MSAIEENMGPAVPERAVEANAKAKATAAGPRLAMPVQNRIALKLSEAAATVGVCKRTLENMRDAGKLRCFRLGRHWHVRVAELEAWVRRLEAESS